MGIDVVVARERFGVAKTWLSGVVGIDWLVATGVGGEAQKALAESGRMGESRPSRSVGVLTVLVLQDRTKVVVGGPVSMAICKACFRCAVCICGNIDQS